MTHEPQLRALIATHLAIDPALVIADATLEQLGADELDCAYLSWEAEEQFGIEFESDELALDAFALEQTFGQVLAVVEAKVADRSVAA